MHADHAADGFHILARGVIGVTAQAGGRVRHHGVVDVDRVLAGQTDGGALHPAGEALKLVRLDVADDDAQLGGQEMAVDPHRRARRGAAQVDQVGCRGGVVAQHRIAGQHVGREHRGVFGGRHGRVAAGGDDQADVGGRQAQIFQRGQQGGQEMGVRHRPGFVVDGDGGRAGAGEIGQPHAAGRRSQRPLHRGDGIGRGRNRARSHHHHRQVIREVEVEGAFAVG